jgi:hypothetical protein
MTTKPTIHLDGNDLPEGHSHGYFIVNFETGESKNIIHKGLQEHCTEPECQEDQE